MRFLTVLAAITVASAGTALNITGVDDTNYYYSFWAADSNSVTVSEYGFYDPGLYNIQWDAGAKFRGGKGWEEGSAQPFQFNTDYSFTGNTSTLALYGVSTDPDVEYFIAEDVGPTMATRLAALPLAGTLTADGAVYNVYQTTGAEGKTQYWSVRRTARDNGVMTPGTHFAGWAALGMPLGQLGQQIFVVEGDAAVGAGSMAVRVLSCGVEYAQCGGQTWPGSTCCQTGLTCVQENAYFSNCFLV